MFEELLTLLGAWTFGSMSKCKERRLASLLLNLGIKKRGCELDADDVMAFGALLEATEDVNKAVFHFQRGQYKFYANVDTDEELANAFFEETDIYLPGYLAEYFDFARFAEDLSAEHDGTFTKFGYVALKA